MDKSILLTHEGGYFFTNPKPISRYEGYYIPIPDPQGWELVKILDRIEIDAKVKTITGNKVTYQNGANITYHLNQGLRIEVNNYTGPIRILLDVHKMHDYDDHNRHYAIKKDTVTYTKDDFNFTFTISSTPKLNRVDNWVEHTYALDLRREAPPYSGWKYHMFTIHCKKSATININKPTKAKTTVPRSALDCAIKSLKQLTIRPPERNTEGVYAGLPWFYQFWTRDEAISLGALKQFQSVKHILLRQISYCLPDGRLGNRFPESKLGSADGIGWTATRILENLDEFTHKELEHIYATLIPQKEALEHNYMHEDLIYNEALETWIDTGKGTDERDGYCIEIQLLHQKLNDLLYHIGQRINQPYDRVNRLELIKETYFQKHLLDRLDKNKQPDATVRINTVIAYYLYPNLLERHEWEQAFDIMLERLWLNWGGLASIDKTSPLYHPFYTGQNNESYHRGDSWYFLNNMAAKCMLQLNQKKYISYIDTILQASAKEITRMGALGHHAEISSAQEQESQGCLAQAWSAALFIEAQTLKNSLSPSKS